MKLRDMGVWKTYHHGLLASCGSLYRGHPGCLAMWVGTPVCCSCFVPCKMTRQQQRCALFGNVSSAQKSRFCWSAGFCSPHPASTAESAPAALQSLSQMTFQRRCHVMVFCSEAFQAENRLWCLILPYVDVNALGQVVSSLTHSCVRTPRCQRKHVWQMFAVTH